MRFILDVASKNGTATEEEIAKVMSIIDSNAFGGAISITLIDDITENQFYSNDEFEKDGKTVKHYHLMNKLSEKQIQNYINELACELTPYEKADQLGYIQRQEEIKVESIAKAEHESEKVETMIDTPMNIPSPVVERVEDIKMQTSPPKSNNSPLSVDRKHITVFEDAIINRMIEDIRESDSDTLIDLIKHMYPVTAKYDEATSEVTLTVTEPGLNLSDIF